MAPSTHQTQPSSLLLLLPLLIIALVLLRANSAPLVPVLPVLKHNSTLQYVTRVYQRTPLVPLSVVLHLGGRVLWVGCGSSYVSSSYRKARCGSPQCALVAHAAGGCRGAGTNGTCTLLVENVLTGKASLGELSEDVLGLSTANGSTAGSTVSVPRVLFSCTPEFLLDGLAAGSEGVMGLSHAQIGTLAQLSLALNLGRIFAICLPPSTGSDGVVFLGDGPYILLPDIDVSKILTYTPLVVHPPTAPPTRGDSPLSYEYVISVRSIRINGRRIRLPAGRDGVGGARISTVDPFAILETPIYESLTRRFVREAAAANVTRVAPVAPFRACFSTGTGQARPALPIIDLMLQSDEVFWRIFETNSMVPVGEGAVCLGFLDGGASPRHPMVIGGLQLEDNLVQIDTGSSRLGFTSSLLLRQTSCANFDFASNSNA